MIRLAAYALSTLYVLGGTCMGAQAYLDTISGFYPWADHIPALCVLVGCLAGYVNAKGFALVFSTRY